MAKPVTGLTAFSALTTATTPSLDANFTAITGAINDLPTYSNYFADSGAANAYVVSSVAGLTYTLATGIGTPIRWLAAHTNSGASTLNVFGTGAISIVGPSGAALTGGEIIAGRIVETVYDGTTHQLASQPPVTTGTLGLPRVVQSKSKNNTGTPLTKWDMTADWLHLRNPSNNAMLVITTTGTKTVDLTVANAPGGTDQAGALTASSFIYFYWIAKADGTLNVVGSQTAPPTGPNLGGGSFSGYVFWGLDSCNRLNASTQLLTATTLSNWMNYTSVPTNLINGTSASVETNITTTLQTFVPAIAQLYRVSGFAHTVGAFGGAENQATMNLYVASTQIYSKPAQISATGPAGTTSSDSCGISETLPNTGYLAWAMNGNLLDPVVTVRVTGFSIPNGG